MSLANPQRFLLLKRKVLPWIATVAVCLIGVGVYLGLFGSPPDYQQGDAVRIMYVHVPSAWLSLALYAVMAAASAWGFIARHPLADVAAKATAPVGAVFTALALATGSLWGKPMWGTWWTWDPRLTSELILLLLYLGYSALWSAIDEPARAARAAGILALAGAVNVPIIHFSVEWWSSLHQRSSVFRMDGPTIDSAMLWPLLLSALGFTLFAVWIVLERMETEILGRRLRALRVQVAERA